VCKKADSIQLESVRQGGGGEVGADRHQRHPLRSDLSIGGNQREGLIVDSRRQEI
jgi:hypothetical protein